DRTRDQRGIDLDLVGAVAQRVQGAFQRVHGHPGAVGATAAGGTAAGGRRLDELLVGAQLLHLVEDAAVGGDDEHLVGQRLGGLDQLTGGAYRVGQLDDRLGGFRMNQHGGFRIQGLHVGKLLGLELLVDDAGAVPEQHVRAGLALDVTTQVLVRGPDQLLAVIHQDRKSTRLNSSHVKISYAVFCLKKKKKRVSDPYQDHHDR